MVYKVYLITKDNEQRVYKSLRLMCEDNGLSVYTMRRSRGVSRRKGDRWVYVRGLLRVEELEMVVGMVSKKKKK